MLRISFLASCWCLGDTDKLCVGVDVATSGKASEVRATCVKIGGIIVAKGKKLFGQQNDPKIT